MATILLKDFLEKNIMHQCYIVSNFYKFLHLNNIEDIKLSLKKEFKKIDLKVRFY